MIERFKGLDTGLDPASIQPSFSPSCRNWVNVDEMQAAHGPRKCSEPFRIDQYSYPVNHAHQWRTRLGTPAQSVFYDNGTNNALTLDNSNYDTEELAVALDYTWISDAGAGFNAMTQDTRYYCKQSSTPNFSTSKEVGFGISPEEVDFTDYRYWEALSGISVWGYIASEPCVFTVGVDWGNYSYVLLRGELMLATMIATNLEFNRIPVSYSSTPSEVFLWFQASEHIISVDVGEPCLIFSYNGTTDLDLIGLK